MKIQASILAVTRPLASGWQNLLDVGLETNPDMLVPAAEVLDLIQRTLCLVGNASEYISQTRRGRILAPSGLVVLLLVAFSDGDFFGECCLLLYFAN